MRILVSVVLAAVVCGPAAAQEIRGSAVSGTLVSRSVTLAPGELAAELLTVPDDADLILTQFCGAGVSTITFPFPTILSQPTLFGSQLGQVPVGTGCTTFEPGLAVAPGETLSCQVSAAQTSEVTCLVNGVLQDHPSHRGRGPR